MTEYYENEINDPEREVIRPKSKKKSDPFVWCKWAAGEWEAQFYAWTETHRKSCDSTINSMMTDKAWFKTKPKKIDTRAAARNNKAKDKKRNG